jgi:hypothetical protein
MAALGLKAAELKMSERAVVYWQPIFVGAIRKVVVGIQLPSKVEHHQRVTELDMRQQLRKPRRNKYSRDPATSAPLRHNGPRLCLDGHLDLRQ